MKMLQFRFVDFIPDEIDEGMLYISTTFCTAIHKCVCGCGNEVVTPLSPTDWELTFDGKSISLYPSIGNWSFECQSHYWITKNRIEHAESWNNRDILQGRSTDKKNKEKNYGEKPTEPKSEKMETRVDQKTTKWSMKSFFSFLGFK